MPTPNSILTLSCHDSGWLYNHSLDIASSHLNVSLETMYIHETEDIFSNIAFIPVALAIAYLWTVRSINRYSRYEVQIEFISPITVIFLSGLWNLTMFLFSSAGAYYTSHLLFGNENTPNTVDCGGFIVLNVLSKPYELIDTLLMALIDKKITTLHWSHHVIAMLYTWWAAKSGENIRPLTSLNYIVNSVVYGYFFVGTFPILKPFCRRISPFITMFQILQFVAGIFYIVSNRFNMTPIFFFMSCAIYLYYFIAFSRLFLSRRLHAVENICSQCRVSSPEYILCKVCNSMYCYNCINTTEDVCKMCDIETF
jgi:hypothetical protein